MSRIAVSLVVGSLVFAVTWLYRFNDPGGSFVGLTDDHFFYVVRGWQMLYGDLPVRDFVDHGAPLYYYIAAALQVGLGRGTLSEVAFAVTVLAAAAAITFGLAARASGSIVAGLLGVLVHVLLGPRLYNYPKIIVYAAAIPLLWRFTDRTDVATRRWLALVAVVAFLLRHDHGAFVATAFGATLALSHGLTWRQKVRHAGWFGIIVGTLLLPYLLFIHVNGGLPQYFQDALSWAARDRARAPVVWPGLFDNLDGISTAQRAGFAGWRLIASVRDNAVAWLFYVELVLPLIALALVAVSANAFRPGWSRARTKIATVAILGVVLNAGFLRSPLEARLADPSVPQVILLAWLLVATVALVRERSGLHERSRRWAPILRMATVGVTTGIAFVLIATLSRDAVRGLTRARFVDEERAGDMTRRRPGRPLERARDVAEQLRSGWQINRRFRFREATDMVALAAYLNRCTDDNDRILVQSYIPQVLGLAERAFAGGHADLRPGFFTSEAAQRLTVSRLEQQSVPLVLLESGEALSNFRESFPLITAFLDARYAPAGERLFGGYQLTLYVQQSRAPVGVFAPLDWPCFAAR